MNIVSAVMLGALPAAAWSTTFKRSSSKAILIFWLLLLAVGHSFFALIIPNQNFHFQICHKDHTESPLQANYQAPYLDQSWRDSFYTLTSTARNYSQIPENGSLPDCIYSCFATSSYTGRKTQDIMVIDNVSDRDSFQALRNNRGTIILFWWAYTFLAFVTFFITEKKTYLPQWVHKQLFSIRYRRKSSASGWKWKTVTNSTIKAAKNSTVTDVLGIAPFIKINITVLKVLHIISQLIGLFAFLGCIIYQETGNIQLRNAESQESFAAVGQWGNVATVLLVLAAAMISRLWTGRGTRSDGALSGGRTCITGDTKLERGDDEDGDMETGKEDWDWRVGYAS
ncbi:hypothetical protein MMC12_007058 [Toensbergia leucococca]|nr:hypothetical protein [Toensbergia leucococca]